jgi:hypothetical protein
MPYTPKIADTVTAAKMAMIKKGKFFILRRLCWLNNWLT